MTKKLKISPADLIFILLIVAAVGIAGIIYLPDYVRYNNALNAVSEGNYSRARDLFSSLGEYMDSADRLTDCEYELALREFENGNYTQSAEMFAALGDYASSSDMLLESNYLEALRLLDSGEDDAAIDMLRSLGKYKDSYDIFIELLNTADVSVGLETPDLATAVELVLPVYGTVDTQTYLETFRNNIPESVIATGFSHTAALRSDGTVAAVGDNTYGQCDTAEWTDIVSISAGGNFTLGLKKDGTVVGCGDNTYGQLDITSLSGVKAIFAGNTDAAAVLTTGQVITCGYNSFEAPASAQHVSLGSYTLSSVDGDGTLFVSEPLNGYTENSSPLHRIYTSAASWLAVYSDGSAAVSFDEDCGWSDVLCGSAGMCYITALCSDGTVKVHAFRENDMNGIDISEYSDLIAVSARSSHIVVLHSDGTLTAFGDNSCGQCNVSEWDLF